MDIHNCCFIRNWLAIMDIHNWIVDIHDWIMGIHNSITDIHNLIMDIHNSIMDIYDYMLAIMDIHNSIMDIHNSIMDIHNSIMDIHNSIMDIHNYRVYALLSFHMSQLIHIKKYIFKIWLGISDHLEIRVSYSTKSLKWNRVEGCYLQHGCYWWLGACLATGYLQQRGGKWLSASGYL